MPVTKITNFQSFQNEVETAENVLVEFEAEWCMPCRAMVSVVEEVAKQHPDVKVVAVDVDGDGMEPVLQKYGVRTVPTFVHVRGGTSVRSASGNITRAELSLLLRDA